MNTIFCPSCGRANQYATTKPNFCNTCGAGFTVAAVDRDPVPPRGNYQTVRASRERTRHDQNDDLRRQREDEYVEDKHELIARVGAIEIIPNQKAPKPGELWDVAGTIFAGGAKDTTSAGRVSVDRPQDASYHRGQSRQEYLKQNIVNKAYVEKRIDVPVS